MFRCRIDSTYECNGCMWCYDPGEDDEDEETAEEEDDERDLLD